MVSSSTGLFAPASRRFVILSQVITNLKRNGCGIGRSGMHAPRFDWPANLPRLLWSPRTCPLCTSLEFTEAELQPMDIWIGRWPSFHCSRFAASTAGEDITAFLTVLASESDGAKRPFCRRVIDLQQPIVDIACERTPV